MPKKKALRNRIKSLKEQIEFLSGRVENLIAEKTILIEKPQSLRAADIKHSHHMEAVLNEFLTTEKEMV